MLRLQVGFHHSVVSFVKLPYFCQFHEYVSLKLGDLFPHFLQVSLSNRFQAVTDQPSPPVIAGGICHHYHLL